MLQIGCEHIRRWTAAIALTITAFYSPSSLALPTHTLANNEWSLISIPADPGSDGTVASLFGDDLPTTDYGSTGQWVMFGLDMATDEYVALVLGDRLSANTGYWILQRTGSSVVVDVPDTLNAPATSASAGCPEAQQCAQITLGTEAGRRQWNLVGFSSDTSLNYGSSRYQAQNSSCTAGCTPEQASAAAVAVMSLSGRERRCSHGMVSGWRF